jgi:hypothetical protein
MNKYEAQNRLHEILEEINELGLEARTIFREQFPDLAEVGDAYGAFTLGRSWNRYDTTLETLVDAAFEDEDEEYEI